MQQRCKDIYDINLKLNHRENHIHLVGRGCVITQTEKGAATGLSIRALKKKTHYVLMVKICSFNVCTIIF